MGEGPVLIEQKKNRMKNPGLAGYCRFLSCGSAHFDSNAMPENENELLKGFYSTFSGLYSLVFSSHIYLSVDHLKIQRKYHRASRRIFKQTVSTVVSQILIS